MSDRSGPGRSLHGLRVEADPSLERHDEGRTIIGGSPLTLLRLGSDGAALLDRLLAGEPVPDTTSASTLTARLLDLNLVQPHAPRSRFGPQDVTVVIPVRGELDPRLLDALGTVGHIVVVDDSSPEPVHTPSHTAAGTGITLLRLDSQHGPGGARNAGWSRSTTALTAFVDADCVPDTDWLEPLLGHFVDPRVEIVAPRIVATDDGPASGEPQERSGPIRARASRARVSRARVSRALRAFERHRSALDLGDVPARVRPGTRVSYVPSATMVLRTELRDRQGFDATMMVGEDVDLVWRIDEDGGRVRYEPSATVAHDHRVEFGAWLRRRFDYGTSAGPLADRHPGTLAPVRVSGWSVAVWILILTGHPFLALSTALTTAVLLGRRLGNVPDATSIAFRLAGRGHLAAGKSLARALLRPWWPFTLVIAALAPSRRLRLTLLAASLAPAVIDWFEERPRLDPATWILCRVADDIAYGSGVWVGALQARCAEPLRPDLRSWPRSDR